MSRERPQHGTASGYVRHSNENTLEYASHCGWADELSCRESWNLYNKNLKRLRRAAPKSLVDKIEQTILPFLKCDKLDKQSREFLIAIIIRQDWTNREEQAT